MPTEERTTSRAATRRLRRDAEANRQQILEAAGRLMAERGLATPLEDIAAAAGVGIATLYRRFPSREELVEALFEDRLAAYLADLETAAAMPDGWQALTWYLRSASARQVADRALKELLEHDPGHGTVSRLLERLWPLAETLVERARATGRLRRDFTVVDLVFVQQMLASIGTATLPLNATAWERYLTIVVDGMVTSRRDATPPGQPALTVAQLEALHANRASQPGQPRYCAR
ncbi:MAG TPA: helix-turn-helix domain-containing protein [Acidimicrobiales bacterium]|nr:helix-turn-helix domain-containing protein [Acidimicrobiales bacterium]